MRSLSIMVSPVGRAVLVLAAACVSSLITRAQELPVGVGGGVHLSSEVYRTSGGTSTRPPHAFRAIVRTTVTLSDQIILPFELYYTNVDRGFRQPFNQFGVSPRFFGWLTVHAGYFSARISELTFGDTRVLGGGVELEPGRFRFAAMYGRLQQAVQPDSANGIPGAYERQVWTGRIGYEHGTESFVVLNVMKVNDDPASIAHPTPSLSPKENFVTSLSFGFPLGASVNLNAEVAGAAFTNDTRSDTLEDVGSAFHWIFTPRASSNVDGAARASLAFRFSPAFNLMLASRWIGPGFVTLGYPQAQNDLLDATVSPAVRLLTNRLSLRASLGLQWNNLRDNRIATTRRVIGSLNAGYQHSPVWGCDLSYSNYGIRQLRANDTLRVQSVSQSATLTPRVTLGGLGGINLLTASLMLQDFDDSSPFSEGRNNYQTRMVLAGWNLTLPSSLSLGLRGSVNRTTSQLASTTVYDIGTTAGYRLLQNTLAVSLTFGWAQVHSTSRDRRLVGGVQFTYTPARLGRFTLMARSNAYETEGDIVSSSRRDFHGSLQYALTF